jgi:hypothetical protein
MGSGETGVTILMGLSGTARFRSACPSPNLSKIITIYASTLVGEIQGLGGCGHIGSRQAIRGIFAVNSSDLFEALPVEPASSIVEVNICAFRYLRYDSDIAWMDAEAIKT